MAQNKKPQQGKRAPAYSADSMVVCLIIGLVLISLGLLLLISAVTQLDGTIFRLLRSLSGGLAGTMSFLLPVIPIWGGVLVIISTQRKPPLREFVLGCLLMVMLCAIVMLLAWSSMNESLPDRIQADNAANGTGGMLPALTRAFEYGSGSGHGYADVSFGGGLIGMLLAWPVWYGFGNGAGISGEVFAAVLVILLALVTFCFLIRLDMKGIIAWMQGKSADASARAEEKRIARAQKEQLRQQQAALAQQQRLQQEQMRMQQLMQQQPMPQTAPQPAPMPADMPDPWQSARPAQPGWNQPRVQAAPQRPAQPIGFQPTPEEDGSYAAPQAMPAAQERKSAFSRSKDAASAEAPRRKSIFARPEPEETVPGEAARPTRRPARAAKAPAAESIWQTEPLQEATAPVEEPFVQPAPLEEEPYAPVIAQPVEEEAPARPTARSLASQRKAASAEPVSEPVQEPAPAPAQPAAKPVREGSFLARMQAAQAAKNGGAPAAEPAPRSTHKDTPSAWSQPEAPASSASWRQEEAPARPSARSRAQAAAPAAPSAAKPENPKKQAPMGSWSDTPPWEDSPEYVDVTPPTAPVMPVLTRQPPEGSYKPELRLAPQRNAMPDGALMETQQERPYMFPPMNLLATPKPQAGISPEEDEIRSRRLENTLQSFKVPAKVRHITHGPAISRFELELAPGVRVSKVTDLNRNIAMNLEVKSVRIEAPIPGKSLVGVEVPNRERATVTLSEVLQSEPMMKATKPLVVALGKDIAGTPIVCDLAKMPHLLIAGATGSGKSVCINTIINSLLYRCSPKDVRLILVDPKVVELQCYNGVPHLLVPVVSDPHKASGALAWAVGEMMDRYTRFQEAGVRAIDGYNESCAPEDKMPRIVIVIDELADLMMTCKKDVEERICRLAQLARAAGIHLIVATQRPSVDVITGLIKANIPSRIAFKVSSNVDSRTILDRIGAEQLLGYGDMLYMPTGEFTPIRVQGCFLSDAEVNRITDYIRETCPATYDPAILEELEKLENDTDAINIPDASADDDYVGGDGSLLMQAIEMAVNDGQVSTSLIQRRLRLGYARAGRLVDEMEKRGIVSQKDGAKPRMCLISREEFEVMKDSGALD